METSTMNIAITIDHAYVPYAYTMLLSLLEHHSTDIHVYVICQELKKEDCCILSALSDSYNVRFSYIAVPEKFCAAVTAFASPSTPAETYFRLFLPEILPDHIDRVLYLDTDLIVNDSLDEFYSIDFAGRKLACAQSSCGTLSTGVLLLNLSLLRSTHALSLPFAVTIGDDLDVHKILSALIHPEEILLIDEKTYNLIANAAFSRYGMRYDTLKDTACILHYAGEKPWDGDHLHTELERFWWDYAEKSPYYPALLEQTMQGIILGTNVQSYISNIQKEHRQLTAIVNQYETLLQRLSFPSK